ncbi:DHH family phosphoesterase [Eubacteriales bacterium mix99]|jgi:c-di-AMP phosphodiesterase-like protein
MKNHFKKLNLPEARIYLAVVLFLALVLLRFDYRVGGMALLVFLLLACYNRRIVRRRKVEWNSYLEALSEDIDWATKNAVLSIPVPLVVIEAGGDITWYNPQFGELFQGEKLLERNIHDFVPELTPSRFGDSRKESHHDLFFHNKWYQVLWTPVKTGNDSRKSKVIFLIYWLDITEEHRIRALYQAQRIVIAHIRVDNYDEVLANTEDTRRAAVLAEIESGIAEWAVGIHAAWVKYDREKFIVVMEAQALKKLQKERFNILDRVRGIQAGNRIPVTLSIGVGLDAENPAQSSISALSAVDLALGRGGDQAVVKQGTKLFFYGGKSQGVEKRTKVKSRVIANALWELMEHSNTVFIMSHEIPDLDSIGSALGIYCCARHVGREAHIVLNKSNVSVEPLMKRLQEKEAYNGLFIRPEDAMEQMDHDTLLVVVDTNRPGFTEAPDLVRKAEHIVVFDHHRRSGDSIENATLTYLESYASSASELVTEVMQYFGENIKVNPLEADALLAGITMDTKNFIFKTGVRTYEAASYLRRLGANPTSVRQLFRDDMDTFVSRSETVKRATMIQQGIAMSECPPDTPNAQLIAAQAADSLLAIQGISASVVLCSTPEGIMISGRSFGSINMQLILEKLGGGGHLTMAGAQLGDISMEEARQRVMDAVEEYLKEFSEEGENK